MGPLWPLRCVLVTQVSFLQPRQPQGMASFLGVIPWSQLLPLRFMPGRRHKGRRTHLFFLKEASHPTTISLASHVTRQLCQRGWGLSSPEAEGVLREQLESCS